MNGAELEAERQLGMLLTTLMILVVMYASYKFAKWRLERNATTKTV